MPTITTNMGLRTWTDPANDGFSFFDLANNFKKVANHTHGPGSGVQLGANSFANSIPGSKLGSDLRVSNFVSGALTNSKMANSHLGVPRMIWGLSVRAEEANPLAASTSYVYTRPVYSWPVGNADVWSSAGNNPVFWQFNASDFAIPGMTTMLCFKAAYTTHGGTAMGASPITFGLFGGGTITGSAGYPVQQPTGAQLGTFTIPGSTANAAMSILPLLSVAAPADGSQYVWGLSVGAGGVVSPSTIYISWNMGVRWV